MKGAASLQACRFAEVPRMVHAMVTTAQEQLQSRDGWQPNSSFAR